MAEIQDIKIGDTVLGVLFRNPKTNAFHLVPVCDISDGTYPSEQEFAELKAKAYEAFLAET